MIIIIIIIIIVIIIIIRKGPVSYFINVDYLSLKLRVALECTQIN